MYNLINIYNWDNTLFDDIQLYEKIDKDTLINTIFDEAGELEPITSHPVLLKNKINVFFKRNYINFKHIYDAYLLEYEPIENYNRISDITVTNKGNNSVKRSDTGTVENNGTGTQTNDLTHTDKSTKAGTTSNTESRNLNDDSEKNSTNTNTVNETQTNDLTKTITGEDVTVLEADNSEGLTIRMSALNESIEYQVPKQQNTTIIQKDETNTVTKNDSEKNTGTIKTEGETKDVYTDKVTNAQTGTVVNNGTTSDNLDNTSKDSGTINNVNSNTETRNLSGTEEGSHNDETITEDRTHGNIGVTTSQQMLQSEIDLWIAFNAYKAMADYFVKELCIVVYD